MKIKDVLIYLLAIVIGGGILMSSWEEIKLGRESEKWPQAEATVKRFDGGALRKGSEKLDLLYVYEVNGIAHIAHRYAFNNEVSYSIDEIKEMQGKYPVGSTVRAYYNPEHPEVSVLVPGLSHHSVIGASIGALFIFAPFLMMWRGRTRREAKSS